MADSGYELFQETVGEYLIRHRSVLDVLSKLHESGARVNRAVAKSVTSCGCLAVNAHRQDAPREVEFSRLRDYMNSHLDGTMCENCREVLEAEVGRTMFYLAALCSLTGLNLNDVMEKERRRVSALGPFNLS